MGARGLLAEHGGSSALESAMFSTVVRLFSRLFGLAVAPRPVPGQRASEPPADGDTPRGCGWFDSSHDLRSGVTVWEGIIVVDNTVATPS
jgi:hypothetical protein